jgi:hypothetical protein
VRGFGVRGRARALSYFILTLSPLFFSAPTHAWIPNTAIDLSLKETCRPEYLEDGLLATRGKLPQIEAVTSAYFKHCEPVFRRKSNSTWLAVAQMPKLEYQFKNRPEIRRVEFVDHKDQVMRPGYLALQPGNRPRPLVIYQCGALCNLEDPSMRSVFIALFDTGVFHVLALPSSTGSEYQKINKVLSMGGLDEGRQLVRIALMIRSPSFPYAKRISDVHLFGVSLGGHSALYASLYADHYERQFKKRAFDSVLLGCPVVKLQESIENITRKSLVGRVFYSSFVSQIVELFDDTPILRDLIPTGRGFRPKYAELRNIIARGALDYYKNKTRDPSWGMSPLEETRIQSLEDLWQTNDYLRNGYPHQLRPFFVFTSSDDPVVLYKQNTLKLLEADRLAANRKVFSLVTPRGHHCMLEAAYSWQTAGAFFRGFFLSQSPEYSRALQRSKLAISPERLTTPFRVRDYELRTEIFWKVDPKNYSINLISNFAHKDCVPRGRMHNSLCHRKSSIPFSYEELGLEEILPHSIHEAQAVERRLNTNYRIYGSAGRYLSRTEDPAQIEILDYLL